MPSLSLRTVLALAAMGSVAVAAPPGDSLLHKLLGEHAILEQVVAPSAWKLAGKPHPESPMKLQIALKQSDITGLQAKLNDIADHNSPNYGKWLSKGEVDAFTAPDVKGIEAITGWLKAAGIADSAISQPSADWMHVEIPVGKAEKLLQANYGMYNHDDHEDSLMRTLAYAIPEGLHQHIETIQPTTSFLYNTAKRPSGIQPKPQHVRRRGGMSDCATAASPDCVRQLYNVDFKGQGLSSGAVVVFNRDTASTSDLAKYLKEYDPKVPSGTKYTEVFIGNATTKPKLNNMEPNLDTQMLVSLSYPNPASMIHAGPDDRLDRFFEDLLSLTDYINNHSNPPRVVSMSYSGDEPKQAHPYYERICNEFSKATARGVSFFMSSGDNGVGPSNNQCTTFRPTFPSGCQYITVVGATGITSDGTGEVAAKFEFIENGTSGGGFSNLFPAPDFQSANTSAYISNYVPASYDGKYNKTGRGYPDVAMLGKNLNIIFKGKEYLAEGTSASSPIFAALIAQINDMRAANNKTSLGWLNPRLYTDVAVRAAMRDITSGNNANCDTNGFTAEAGWDPVTGLGTFDFAALRKAFA
ncbi:hypothetical protein VHEMI04327 [[Torrubiella] hemipterigena]|uniref:tripeptidyl-peptidase II n=1 Tax=[Torrubiella] hemipterigena TaxID=1531966 RepID=A0A0A1TG01_9HYPO|nr:hypothetical protein VHEMI04327 [[Torrubiella] hemipterigena]